MRLRNKQEQDAIDLAWREYGQALSKYPNESPSEIAQARQKFEEVCRGTFRPFPYKKSDFLH